MQRILRTVVIVLSLCGSLAAADGDSRSAHLNNVFSTSSETPGFARLIPEDQTVVVRGVVLGPDGATVAGAEVWAAAVFVDPPLRERVMSDAEGRFVLRLKPLQGRSARWSVHAYREDLGGDANDRYGTVELKQDQPAPVIEIRLRERSVVHGRILAEESDQPIADARIYCDDGRIVISDADGYYRIPGLRQENHDWYFVARQRVRRHVHCDNTGQSDCRLDIRLQPAVDLSAMSLTLIPESRWRERGSSGPCPEMRWRSMPAPCWSVMTGSTALMEFR